MTTPTSPVMTRWMVLMTLVLFAWGGGVASAEENPVDVPKSSGEPFKGYSAEKYSKKGVKARKAWLKEPKQDYDPNMTVYCDALWMRVHAPDCPMLVLKDVKKTMTLEEADKAGWRIGETGQSGRERCCLHGYHRKYAEAEILDDTIGVVQIMKDGERHKYHMAGCHRFTMSPDNLIMTLGEAKKLQGYYLCIHCLERGPNSTFVNAELFNKAKSASSFAPPAGWVAKPYAADTLPSKEELGIIVEEALASGAEEFVPEYRNPIATLEEFMGRRFFFRYSTDYKLYRATGDKRLLDKLLKSAEKYYDICAKYPSVAQVKARDPEHMNFLSPVALWSRATLQLARKYPAQVSKEELAKAEAFLLNGIVVALKPTWESNDDLDPDMGLPKKLADDFKSRAFNRAANGIATLATTAAALEDLQALKKTTDLQPTIDRYRKCVQEWVKNWKRAGCTYTEADGKTYFYYPYREEGNEKRKNGLLLGGMEDQGHYQYSVSGALLMNSVAPELGCDDEHMTAMANAVLYNSLTKKHGSIACPSADAIKPYSRKEYVGGRTGFYALEAFTDGVIKGQCVTFKPAKAEAELSEYNSRVETLYGHYFKALRKDRSLIHLGEK